MRNLDKRLTRLEKAVIPDGKRFAVVTYDVPIQIVPLRSVVLLRDWGGASATMSWG